MKKLKVYEKPTFEFFEASMQHPILGTSQDGKIPNNPLDGSADDSGPTDGDAEANVFRKGIWDEE